MPRPKKNRHIAFHPGVTYFKPQGIPMHQLEEIDISLDELESLRLKYKEGKNNAEGAKEMKISAATYQRLIVSALQKITEALVEGKSIKLHTMIDFYFPGQVSIFQRRRQRRGGFRRRRL